MMKKSLCVLLCISLLFLVSCFEPRTNNMAGDREIFGSFEAACDASNAVVKVICLNDTDFHTNENTAVTEFRVVETIHGKLQEGAIVSIAQKPFAPNNLGYLDTATVQIQFWEGDTYFLCLTYHRGKYSLITMYEGAYVYQEGALIPYSIPPAEYPN